MAKKIVSLILLASLIVCFPACGNSGKNGGKKTYPWPTNTFFGELIPPAAEQVDRIEKTGKKGFRRVVIYIDEYSYEDFLDYVDRLEAAGCVEYFDKNGVYPVAPSNEKAMFASNTIDGACITMFWFPKDYLGYEHSFSMQIAEYDTISQ